MEYQNLLGAHHDSSERYLSDPNPELGDTVVAWMRVPLTDEITEVTLRAVWDGEPFRIPAVCDHITTAEAWWRVELPIRSPLVNYRFHLRDRSQRTCWLNGEGVHCWDVTDAADFRISTRHRPPHWVRHTVWYQIFPDRFARRADGQWSATPPDWVRQREWTDPVDPSLPQAMFDLWGGSLEGVADHLDHLVSLGVTGIYLCPVFPAHSNHRYDAASFDRVDPVLGGDDGLRRLTREAADRGIRVIGDLTTNHSGNHHEWFLAAQADPSSPTRDFYFFDDDGDYEAWLGFHTLPKLNHAAAGLGPRLYDGPESAAGRFLSREFGLSGWRIDVANMTGRSGENDFNQQCAQALRRTIDAVRPDAWLVAEHVHDASDDLDGSGWHGTMNYSGFTRPAWTWLADPVQPDEISLLGDPGPLARRTGGEVMRSARAFMARVPYTVTLTNMNMLGSHDTARWAMVVGGDTSRSAVGMAMLMTWPGAPTMFAGDEIGVGGDPALEATWDITARQPYPWHDPASWDRELRVDIETLISLRRESSALSVGGMRWVAAGDDALVYVRESRDETILVHLARAAHDPIVVDGDVLGAGSGQRLAGSASTLMSEPFELTATGCGWQLIRIA